MSFQFGQQQQPLPSLNRPMNKRRMDEEEPMIVKRYFDLHTKFSPDLIPAPQEHLPAITYASPDYRPPPSNVTPLWLLPVNAASPFTEDDSEDDTLLTPSSSMDTDNPIEDAWVHMN